MLSGLQDAANRIDSCGCGQRPYADWLTGAHRLDPRCGIQGDSNMTDLAGIGRRGHEDEVTSSDRRGSPVNGYTAS